MPSLLPALAKTWQISGNNEIAPNADSAVQFRAMLTTMKTRMLGWASAPWTVVGSSNGTTFGLDGVDRWTGAFASGSWIVLRQTGHGYNIDLLIHISNLFNTTLDMYVSTAGFTGGGATTRPTATDEVTINGTGTSCAANSNTRMWFNIQQSTDGQCLRMWSYWSNVVGFFFMLDKLKNPVPGLTRPWVAQRFRSISGTGTNTVVYGAFNNSSWRGWHNGQIDYSMSLEAVTGNSPLGQNANTNIPNEVAGGYPVSPCGMVCTTATKRGRHGELFDVWLGANTLLESDTYPGPTETPLHQFIQLSSCVVLPWNQTVPNIT